MPRLVMPTGLLTQAEHAANQKANHPSNKRGAYGYWGTPGKGSLGERCWTCLHAERHSQSNAWWKCARCRSTWTSGRGTDIKVKSPACEGWEFNPALTSIEREWRRKRR